MAYSDKVIDHYENPRNVGSLDKEADDVGTGLVGAPACGDVMKLQIKVDDQGVIQDAKFKTFGCGSAIASSSLVTEWVKGKTLDEALDFTRDRFSAVGARHPGIPLVLGEAGWATRRHDEGEQARLIRGEASEAAQRVFLERFSGWVARERIVSTWFEAFDENWKGGPHPDEVEKHWGIYRADRTPKAAVRD